MSDSRKNGTNDTAPQGSGSASTPASPAQTPPSSPAVPSPSSTASDIQALQKAIELRDKAAAAMVETQVTRSTLIVEFGKAETALETATTNAKNEFIRHKRNIRTEKAEIEKITKNLGQLAQLKAKLIKVMQDAAAAYFAICKQQSIEKMQEFGQKFGAFVQVSVLDSLGEEHIIETSGYTIYSLNDFQNTVNKDLSHLSFSELNTYVNATIRQSLGMGLMGGSKAYDEIVKNYNLLSAQLLPTEEKAPPTIIDSVHKKNSTIQAVLTAAITVESEQAAILAPLKQRAAAQALRETQMKAGPELLKELKKSNVAKLTPVVIADDNARAQLDVSTATVSRLRQTYTLDVLANECSSPGEALKLARDEPRNDVLKIIALLKRSNAYIVSNTSVISIDLLTLTLERVLQGHADIEPASRKNSLLVKKIIAALLKLNQSSKDVIGLHRYLNAVVTKTTATQPTAQQASVKFDDDLAQERTIARKKEKTSFAESHERSAPLPRFSRELDELEREQPEDASSLEVKNDATLKKIETGLARTIALLRYRAPNNVSDRTSADNEDYSEQSPADREKSLAAAEQELAKDRTKKRPTNRKDKDGNQIFEDTVVKMSALEKCAIALLKAFQLLAKEGDVNNSTTEEKTAAAALRVAALNEFATASALIAEVRVELNNPALDLADIVTALENNNYAALKVEFNSSKRDVNEVTAETIKAVGKNNCDILKNAELTNIAVAVTLYNNKTQENHAKAVQSQRQIQQATSAGGGMARVPFSAIVKEEDKTLAPLFSLYSGTELCKAYFKILGTPSLQAHLAVVEKELSSRKRLHDFIAKILARKSELLLETNRASARASTTLILANATAMTALTEQYPTRALEFYIFARKIGVITSDADLAIKLHTLPASVLTSGLYARQGYESLIAAELGKRDDLDPDKKADEPTARAAIDATLAKLSTLAVLVLQCTAKDTAVADIQVTDSYHFMSSVWKKAGTDSKSETPASSAATNEQIVAELFVNTALTKYMILNNLATAVVFFNQAIQLHLGTISTAFFSLIKEVNESAGKSVLKSNINLIQAVILINEIATKYSKQGLSSAEVQQKEATETELAKALANITPVGDTATSKEKEAFIACMQTLVINGYTLAFGSIAISTASRFLASEADWSALYSTFPVSNRVANKKTIIALLESLREQEHTLQYTAIVHTFFKFDITHDDDAFLAKQPAGFFAAAASSTAPAAIQACRYHQAQTTKSGTEWNTIMSDATFVASLTSAQLLLLIISQAALLLPNHNTVMHDTITRLASPAGFGELKLPLLIAAILDVRNQDEKLKQLLVTTLAEALPIDAVLNALSQSKLSQNELFAAIKPYARILVAKTIEQSSLAKAMVSLTNTFGRELGLDLIAAGIPAKTLDKQIPGIDENDKQYNDIVRVIVSHAASVARIVELARENPASAKHIADRFFNHVKKTNTPYTDLLIDRNLETLALLAPASFLALFNASVASGSPLKSICAKIIFSKKTIFVEAAKEQSSATLSAALKLVPFDDINTVMGFVQSLTPQYGAILLTLIYKANTEKFGQSLNLVNFDSLPLLAETILQCPTAPTPIRATLTDLFVSLITKGSNSLGRLNTASDDVYNSVVVALNELQQPNIRAAFEAIFLDPVQMAGLSQSKRETLAKVLAPESNAELRRKLVAILIPTQAGNSTTIDDGVLRFYLPYLAEFRDEIMQTLQSNARAEHYLAGATSIDRHRLLEWDNQRVGKPISDNEAKTAAWLLTKSPILNVVNKKFIPAATRIAAGTSTPDDCALVRQNLTTAITYTKQTLNPTNSLVSTQRDLLRQFTDLFAETKEGFTEACSSVDWIAAQTSDQLRQRFTKHTAKSSLKVDADIATLAMNPALMYKLAQLMLDKNNCKILAACATDPDAVEKLLVTAGFADETVEPIISALLDARGFEQLSTLITSPGYSLQQLLMRTKSSTTRANFNDLADALDDANDDAYQVLRDWLAPIINSPNEISYLLAECKAAGTVVLANAIQDALSKKALPSGIDDVMLCELLRDQAKIMDKHVVALYPNSTKLLKAFIGFDPRYVIASSGIDNTASTSATKANLTKLAKRLNEFKSYLSTDFATDQLFASQLVECLRSYNEFVDAATFLPTTTALCDLMQDYFSLNRSPEAREIFFNGLFEKGMDGKEHSPLLNKLLLHCLANLNNADTAIAAKAKNVFVALLLDMRAYKPELYTNEWFTLIPFDNLNELTRTDKRFNSYIRNLIANPDDANLRLLRQRYMFNAYNLFNESDILGLLAVEYQATKQAERAELIARQAAHGPALAEEKLPANRKPNRITVNAELALRAAKALIQEEAALLAEIKRLSGAENKAARQSLRNQLAQLRKQIHTIMAHESLETMRQVVLGIKEQIVAFKREGDSCDTAANRALTLLKNTNFNAASLQELIECLLTLPQNPPFSTTVAELVKKQQALPANDATATITLSAADTSALLSDAGLPSIASHVQTQRDSASDLQQKLVLTALEGLSIPVSDDEPSAVIRLLLDKENSTLLTDATVTYYEGSNKITTKMTAGKLPDDCTAVIGTRLYSANGAVIGYVDLVGNDRKVRVVSTVFDPTFVQAIFFTSPLTTAHHKYCLTNILENSRICNALLARVLQYSTLDSFIAELNRAGNQDRRESILTALLKYVLDPSTTLSKNDIFILLKLKDLPDDIIYQLLEREANDAHLVAWSTDANLSAQVRSLTAINLLHRDSYLVSIGLAKPAAGGQDIELDAIDLKTIFLAIKFDTLPTRYLENLPQQVKNYMMMQRSIYPRLSKEQCLALKPDKDSINSVLAFLFKEWLADKDEACQVLAFLTADVAIRKIIIDTIKAKKLDADRVIQFISLCPDLVEEAKDLLSTITLTPERKKALLKLALTTHSDLVADAQNDLQRRQGLLGNIYGLIWSEAKISLWLKEALAGELGHFDLNFDISAKGINLIVGIVAANDKALFANEAFYAAVMSNAQLYEKLSSNPSFNYKIAASVAGRVGNFDFFYYSYTDNNRPIRLTALTELTAFYDSWLVTAKTAPIAVVRRSQTELTKLLDFFYSEHHDNYVAFVTRAIPQGQPSPIQQTVINHLFGNADRLITCAERAPKAYPTAIAQFSLLHKDEPKEYWKSYFKQTLGGDIAKVKDAASLLAAHADKNSSLSKFAATAYRRADYELVSQGKWSGFFEFFTRKIPSMIYRWWAGEKKSDYFVVATPDKPAVVIPKKIGPVAVATLSDGDQTKLQNDLYVSLRFMGFSILTLESTLTAEQRTYREKAISIQIERYLESGAGKAFFKNKGLTAEQIKTEVKSAYEQLQIDKLLRPAYESREYLLSVNKELADRHVAIKGIQTSINEVATLFADCHDLVVMQGKALNIVVSNIETAKILAEQAFDLLQRAEIQQVARVGGKAGETTKQINDPSIMAQLDGLAEELQSQFNTICDDIMKKANIVWFSVFPSLLKPPSGVNKLDPSQWALWAYNMNVAISSLIPARAGERMSAAVSELGNVLTTDVKNDAIEAYRKYLFDKNRAENADRRAANQKVIDGVMSRRRVGYKGAEPSVQQAKMMKAIASKKLPATAIAANQQAMYEYIINGLCGYESVAAFWSQHKPGIVSSRPKYTVNVTDPVAQKATKFQVTCAVFKILKYASENPQPANYGEALKHVDAILKKHITPPKGSNPFQKQPDVGDTIYHDTRMAIMHVNAGLEGDYVKGLRDSFAQHAHLRPQEGQQLEHK